MTFVLYVHYSDKCRVYRIGGDEFLLIIDNPKNNETESVVQFVYEKLAIADDIKVPSAVGIADGRRADILVVVKRTDSCIYENKKIVKEEK